jgi:hypothetical protein
MIIFLSLTPWQHLGGTAIKRATSFSEAAAADEEENVF